MLATLFPKCRLYPYVLLYVRLWRVNCTNMGANLMSWHINIHFLGVRPCLKYYH